MYVPLLRDRDPIPPACSLRGRRKRGDTSKRGLKTAVAAARPSLAGYQRGDAATRRFYCTGVRLRSDLREDSGKVDTDRREIDRQRESEDDPRRAETLSRGDEARDGSRHVAGIERTTLSRFYDR